MNWVRNNRFLAGFLVFMLVGVGGLGFLLYQRLGRYSSVDDQYKSQVAELKRLEALQPYPDQANQKKYEEPRTNYSQAVRDLQADLASYDPPPRTRRPRRCNSRTSCARRSKKPTPRRPRPVSTSCRRRSFTSGSSSTAARRPKPPPTPLLSYELNAVNDLVSILIQGKRIDSLTYIKRGLLPGEAGVPGAAPTPAALPGRPGAAATPPPLVVKYPVEIAFSATPNAFREILDAITTSKRLFIVRALQVKNQVPTGPLRALPEAPGAAPGAVPAATPAPVDPNNPANTQPLPEKGPCPCCVTWSARKSST